MGQSVCVDWQWQHCRRRSPLRQQHEPDQTNARRVRYGRDGQSGLWRYPPGAEVVAAAVGMVPHGIVAVAARGRVDPVNRRAVTFGASTVAARVRDVSIPDWPVRPGAGTVCIHLILIHAIFLFCLGIGRTSD